MLRKSIHALSSLKLAIACLATLMLLVIACTLDQVHLGTFRAVDKYFRSFLIYWTPFSGARRIPVAPGGGLVGLVLLVNLVVAHAARFQWTRHKAGIWLTHAGLILLILGECLTGLFAVETQMAIDEGSHSNYSESPSDSEIAVVDASPAAYDEVVAIPRALFSRKKLITHPRLAFALRPLAYYPNAAIAARPEGAPKALATSGLGPGLLVQPLPRVSTDDRRDQETAYVELLDGNRSLGVWLLSLAIEQPQEFAARGHRYLLSLRPRRYYMPFTLALKDFRHAVYSGTAIPKDFSSSVRLIDEDKNEARDVRIYMNNPLRYRGRTFYQSSYGKGDTMSVFQVVENPAWRMPYVACALVALGLLLQFFIHLAAFTSARRTQSRA